MLELRPNCEQCDKPLPPASLDARICSFECTFCSNCVEKLLHNVCPNCGGGFTTRPIRPSTDWKNGNTLNKYPASLQKVSKPIDPIQHAKLVAAQNGLPPEKR